ncbi:MAG TPA: beta-ketoacyl-ACP synthase III [Armatimonadota bacterium]|jgi:3-oxoacyl-[acyl-carrier-protein] synthase-3
MNSLPSIGIVSIGAYAPPDVLTNFDLEKIVDTSDEWIRTRSGISTRHISGADCATSDLSIQAARLALERAELAPQDLDLIVVATITPDYPLPSTACILQHRLGAEHAAAFDLSAACTGFIYALSMASAQLQTGQFRNALIIGAESLSKVTDYTDRGTCVLLGDGAGAVILKQVPEGRGFLSSYLRADGGGMECLIIPAGGSRCPASIETTNNRMHYIRMNGSEVFKFAVRVVEEAVITALDRAGLTTADVTLMVPHQANSRIIDAAAKRLAIPAERWANNIAEYGNTSAASIPMALNECYEAGRLHEGDVIVLVGFGGGLTWGATVLRW